MEEEHMLKRTRQGDSLDAFRNYSTNLIKKNREYLESEEAGRTILVVSRIYDKSATSQEVSDYKTKDKLFWENVWLMLKPELDLEEFLNIKWQVEDGKRTELETSVLVELWCLHIYKHSRENAISQDSLEYLAEISHHPEVRYGPNK